MTILIAGGAGYIGSHINLELSRNGIDTIVFDNLSRGHREHVLTDDFVLSGTGRIRQKLSWGPVYTDIEDIFATAYDWHKKSLHIPNNN